MSGAFAQWELVNPKPINAILYDIQFINDSCGWAIGEFGSIQHSSNGGISWEVRYRGEELWENLKLNALYFIDIDNGWVVGTHKINGDKGIILHTSDGGINWESQSSGNYPGSFNDVTFVDELNGWIVGEVGHILKTNNGGVNWISHYMGSSFLFRSVSSTDVDHVWVAGSCTQNDQGIIYRTDNAGLNWESYLLDTNYRAIAINFSDSLIGWVTVYGFSPYHDCKVLQTTDGGKSWIDKNVFDNYYYPVFDIKDIYFIDSNNGWITFRSITGWFILNTSDGGDNWYDQYTGMAFDDLPSICFIDSLMGWAVGENTIVHTSDGGDNWLPQNTVTNLPLRSVCFVDDSTGWASGTKMIYGINAWANTILYTNDGGKEWYEQGDEAMRAPMIGDIFFVDKYHGWVLSFDFMVPKHSIMRTADGGINWEQINIENGHGLNSLFFIDTSNGWVIGNEGAIFHTTDGGLNWEDQSIDSLDLYFSEVFFVDANHGWALGIQRIETDVYDSHIYATSDGGNSWEIQYSLTGIGLRGICFTDIDKGWVVGENIILHTNNGGIYWEQQESEIYDLSDIYFTDTTHGWAVGGNEIIYTINGGVTWEKQTNVSGRNLNDIYFTDHNHGWIVGELGTILRTDNGGATGFEEAKDRRSMIEIQTYPNPFTTSTTITYELLQLSTVQITIYNHLGAQIEVIEKSQPQGLQKVVWSPVNLPNGVYYIRLQVGRQVATGKMILMR